MRIISVENPERALLFNDKTTEKNLDGKRNVKKGPKRYE